MPATTEAMLRATSTFSGRPTQRLDPGSSRRRHGPERPLALMFAVVTIDCLRRDRRVLAGLAVGAMLYKMTLALPMFAPLVLRRQWVSLFVAMVVAVGWYLLGVAGSAGDWMWPTDWLSPTSGYFVQDTYQNVNKTIALPGLMQEAGPDQARTAAPPAEASAS